MYLARKTVGGKAHYVIRESFRQQDACLWRDLCDLGTDPARYIVYPGGNAFYIDDAVEETIRSLGSEPVPEDMENMFWPFLRPDIRYKLEPFRRQERRRRDERKAPESLSPESVHLFDRRRVHFLKTGQMDQRAIGRMPVSTWRAVPGQIPRRDRAGFHGNGVRSPTPGIQGLHLRHIQPAAVFPPAVRQGLPRAPGPGRGRCLLHRGGLPDPRRRRVLGRHGRRRPSQRLPRPLRDHVLRQRVRVPVRSPRSTSATS